jgi:hypothetical protein
MQYGFAGATVARSMRFVVDRFEMEALSHVAATAEKCQRLMAFLKHLSTVGQRLAEDCSQKFNAHQRGLITRRY